MLPPMLTAHPGPQTLLLTALALLIAAATIMLACGPVAQPIPDAGDTLAAAPQAAGSGEEPAAEPTDTPTPAPTNNYPNLDASLQDVVRKFEAGDLTECQAAAQDLAHHASSVLVEVELAANIDAVDTWMASQGISPRHKDAAWVPPHIYAYVPVSLLGALSLWDGVSLIRMSSGIFTDSRDANEKIRCDGEASGVSGAGGASGASETAEPQLPLWLKGVHPYPRLGTGSKLGDVVYRYEQGEITEAAAAAEIGYNYGSAVRVAVEVVNDPAKTDAIVSWLRGKNITPNDVARGHMIVAYIPVSVLGELSNQPGVTRILGPQKPSTNQESPEVPQGAAAGPPLTPEPAAPTDMPTPEVLAKMSPQETENPESPKPTATPTPRPTVCLTRPDGPDICVPGPAWEPEPTPKYPKLGAHYSRLAVEAEEAAASQAGGVSDPSEVEVPTEYVEIRLTDKASVAAVAAWLSENRVPTIPNWRQGDQGYIVSVGDNNIFAVIPIALLEPLSRQRGFAGIINGCRRSLC